MPEFGQYCRIYRNMVENNLGTKNQCLVVGVYARFAAVVVFAVVEVVEVVVEVVVIVVVVKELVFSSRYQSISANMTYFHRKKIEKRFILEVGEVLVSIFYLVTVEKVVVCGWVQNSQGSFL